MKFKRAKTPTILQMEATECGAASLGIILAYYGKFISLPELRQECGISRNGSKAANIIGAAERLGLKACGYRYTPEEIKDLPMPIIVHWGFNHFLVVEGIYKDSVYLNDPAEGHRIVSWQEFEEQYTGITLTFSPTSDFKPGGRPMRVMPIYFSWLKNSRQALSFILIIGLGLAFLGLVQPFINQLFFDDIMTYKHREWMFNLLLALFAVIITKGLLLFLRFFSLTRWQGSLTIGQGARFFRHILRLSIDFFQQRYIGEVASRIQFNENIASFVTGSLAPSILDALTALFYLFLLWEYNIELTLIGLFFTAINIGVLWYTYHWLTEQQMKIQQETGKLYGLAISGLSTIETLKANGHEGDFFVKWVGYQADLMDILQKNDYYTQLINLVPVVLSGINAAIVMAVGSFEIMDGFMTVGIFVAFQNLMSNFQTPVNNITGMIQSIQETHSQLLRLEDVLNYDVDSFYFPQEEIKPADKYRLSGKLELKKVSFGYARLEKPMLKKLNLKLEPGRRVALVGSSGSGKSTAGKLIAGLLQPWSGEILFDDLPINDLPREVLANSLSMVEQDIVLFKGTIRDNIALFDQSISQESIIRAAKDAMIHDDIVHLNGGYDYLLDEGGYQFSGGQRQRLEIARALATDPALLILDEATSALDPVTEKQVMDNIRRRGCACVIIAHRLSTIRDCDEIIVLQKGRVAERGNHHSLLEKGGVYSKLISQDGGRD